ncbi:polymorphic outer membrane protein middle domain-containing protein [Chlamydia suis]|uniref:polymorphic outer membrane protein middle domain-containing protein n=1 Tax=Chlamydia suis TaxID=83559 RepID=UPI0009E38B02|nr:polymorphic outer membrane protein middle domain-containing protein [Chlamydia suis]
MKFLSATAVFAAALPSVTEANTSESPKEIKDLSSSRTESSSSPFTETIPEGGAEYKISGDVSFSSFSNIPEEIKDPSLDSGQEEQEEDVETAEESSLESLKTDTDTEENSHTSSSDTQEDNAQQPSPQEAASGTEGSSSSTTTASSSTPPSQTQNSAIALRSFLYSLQAETEEQVQQSQEDVDGEETTSSGPTEEGQQGAAEEGQQEQSKNTSSGGGAFYNPHDGTLSLVNNPKNPGSLTLSKIRVTGEGGAIYSKGPLSIKDLKQLVLTENLSKKAGGAILGESTVTITGVDTLTFTKNAVEVTFVDKPETQNPSNGSGTEDSSDSSDASDSDSSRGNSNGVSSDTQAVAFSRFLSASSSVEPQPEGAENADSSLNVKLGCGGGIYSKGKLTVSDSKEISFNENSATKDGGGIYSENDISVSSAEKVLFTGNTAGVVGKESATDNKQPSTDQEQGPQESASNSVSSPDSSPDSTASQQSPTDSTNSQESRTASARLTQLSLTRSASTDSGSTGQENSLQQTEQASETHQQDGQETENNRQEQDSSNESRDAEQSNSETNQSPGSPSSGSESSSPTTPQSPTPEVIKPVVGRGGAVYTEKSLTVTDVTKLELVKNSATGAGGAIYATDKVSFTTTTASNTSDARDPGETTISENKASGCGGGVCTKVFSASNLKTLTLSKNTSEKSGGAIYTDLDALKTPEKSETKQPTPPPSIPEAPAAAAKTSRFVATTSTTQSETVVASPDRDIDVFINEVLQVSITENKAAKKGGGVYGKKAKFSNLDKLDISNNTAQDIGGGLCLTESVEFDAIGSLSTSNNSAIAQGAGIYAKTVTITNTKSAFTFANNTVKATEDPKPEVAQPEGTAPSEGENQSSPPSNEQDQPTSSGNEQQQEQAGAEGSDSEEASVVSNGQEGESEERSEPTSFSVRKNENSDSEAQHLPEPSQEISSTEETHDSNSEPNVESNNSSHTDSTANTDSTEGNQNPQTGDQENRNSNENESVSSSAGSEEQRTESENTDSRVSSQSEPSAANSGQEGETEEVSNSHETNQQESQVRSNSEGSEQEVASEEESASASSLETNNENSVSETHTLSEESQEISENTEPEVANTSEHTQTGEQTSEHAASSTTENERSEVENSEASNQDSSGSSTNSLETQATASSRVAILSSANTVGSSSDASSPSESPRSDTSEGDSGSTEGEGESEAEEEAESPDGETQPEGSSDALTLVAGGAIWGDTVKIENFSGNGTFSNNTVIDNQNSGSTANVLGGAIYAKTSLDINNENSNRSIVFSENSVSSKSSSGQVAGGAIFSPTVTINAPVVFSKNSATHDGTKPKDGGANPQNGGATLKDTFGGAIGATTSVSISNGARFSENTADIGSAIGLVTGAIPVANNPGAATVSDSGTQSTTPAPQNENAVRLEGGSYYFEKNKALKRATIYAPTVSIKAYTATFNQNSSAEEGSAIYFTKEASIESLGSVLFTGNLVTPTNSTTTISKGNVQKYGAAIFGQLADTNGTQPDSQTTPENLPLKLIASGGNISFRNNEYRPTAPNIGESTFCSIGGDVKLSMQAAEGKTISFFDAIRTTTKKTGTRADAYDTLDINQSSNTGAVNSAFTGTIMFSSELHENKSYIPQNVVLHSGSLVLKANTELHVISFEQKEGSSLIMEPGAVLSNQATADGSLVINNLTIDLSSVGTTVSSGGGLFTPPELRIVDTTGGGSSGAQGGSSGAQPEGSGGSQTGGGNGSAEGTPGNGSVSGSQDPNSAGSDSSSTSTAPSSASGGNEAGSSTASSPSAPAPSSTPSTTAASAQASITKNLTAATPAAPAVPATTGNKVIIDGVITLVDPNGTFFQNPALGSSQTISLLVLPKDPNQMQAQKVVLTGDVSPQKGYTGTLTLDLSDLKKGIQAQWTFKSYRQWVYIPRDNHFYANSILGSQMSMATVKQGLINDKLNLARFDEVAYNNLWVSGVGTKLSQRGGPRSEEMTYYSRGASVALDAKPAQDLIIGAAFSKMIGRSKSLKQEHNYTHKGSEYSYQASVYGGRPFHLVMNRGTERTLPLLLQGVISYGYIKHDTVTHYPTIRERNKGEWEDLGWLAALRLSSVLKAPTQGDSKRISVFGEFEYSSIRQKQFTETEYDPRYFGNCTYRNLAIPLGLALEGEFKGNDILMYNRFSVAYMPSIYRNSPVCKYKVLSSGEGGEIICGVPTRNTSRAEYSTQLYLGPLWTLYGSYTLEADAHTLANMINCGARMTF